MQTYDIQQYETTLYSKKILYPTILSVALFYNALYRIDLQLLMSINIF